MTQSTHSVVLDRLLVKPVEAVERNLGGIIVKDTPGGKAYEAVVVISGPDVPEGLQGRHVVLGVSPLGVPAGAEVYVDKVLHRVVKLEDVLVVL